MAGRDKPRRETKKKRGSKRNLKATVDDQGLVRIAPQPELIAGLGKDYLIVSWPAVLGPEWEWVKLSVSQREYPMVRNLWAQDDPGKLLDYVRRALFVKRVFHAPVYDLRPFPAARN